MKNKNKFLVTLAIFSGFFLNSCSEEIVDLEPFGTVKSETAFSSPTLVLAAVNGVYNAAQMGVFNGTEAGPAPRGYVFGAAYFQQNEARGEDVVNTQAFYQITYEANYDATTANNVFYWSDGYQLINKANVVLKGLDGAVEKGTITEAVANGYRAEIRFWRAYAHLELLKHFSMPYFHTPNASHPGIPYRTEAIITPQDVDANLTKGRNTVAECYTLALADLDFAEQNAPTKAQRAGIDKIVKVTKGAAISLKIIAFQNMKMWPSVLTEFAKLPSQYILEANPMAVFANNYGNNESVLSIYNTANTNPGVNGALASQFNRRNLIAISPIIWRDAAWLVDDKRREETAVVDNAVFTRKYKDATNYSDGSPLIRYSEMVLAAAEANARLSNTDVALTLLNSVRNRALAAPLTQAYTSATFGTPADLVRGILKERRIEFICEGKRWGDIHRLLNDDIAPTSGIPSKFRNGFPPVGSYTLGTPFTGTLTAAIPSTDRRFLWPIPLQETNNNPTLKAQQNPGW
ncbi:RagB/SusD family nutrient uptake outer membrane protein [Flavobacterium caseinilyticum]|uniref:RagB/SusD family nutrient uptake outer membrane protein n=1 Tax=Flavobacterium caseinilyticum TaxID=2541732 RepID=A0A4R5B6D9_9FLAO|nr:RagB/SusD family nutrient uptake outer membrane protein [Flavobacterium caseinilyticum]TDD78802.1 RagB/SusD family nutrient uptake outer membrane protein [Flavobacterium caseinilyticum]